MTTLTLPPMQKPDPRLMRAAILYLCFFLPLLLTTIALLIMLTFWVPHCVEIFRDFRTSLPLLTQSVISLSDFARSPFMWFAILFATLAFPLLPAWFLSAIRIRSRRIIATLALLLLLLLMCLTLCGTIILSMELPMTRLIQSTSGGETAGEN